MKKVKVICPKCGNVMIYKNWFSWILRTPFHLFSRRWAKCTKCGEYSYVKRVRQYYYFVNTFDNTGYPIQVDGYVEAESELDAIQKVKDSGAIDVNGYEFLDLYVVDDKMILKR